MGPAFDSRLAQVFFLFVLFIRFCFPPVESWGLKVRMLGMAKERQTQAVFIPTPVYRPCVIQTSVRGLWV